MLFYTQVTANNNNNKNNICNSYEIIENVMRIRVKYPPTIMGRIKLWNDYLSF